MKRFAETLIGIKSCAAYVFIAQLMAYVIGLSLTGHATAVPFAFIWQIFALSLITALLQYAYFDESVIRKMRYSIRMALFAASLFATLAVFAVFGRWFPVDRAIPWLLFTLIFFLVLAIVTAACEVHYRITGKRYTNRLEAFRSEGMTDPNDHI